MVIISPAQSTYNKYYTSGSLSSARAIAYDANNNPIIISYYKDSASFGQQGLDLKKLDINGNVILRKRFLFGDLDFLSFSNNRYQCEISNSTILSIGGSYSGTVSSIIFTSNNKNSLDTNWSKIYKDGIFNYYVNNVQKIKQNEVWYMGTRGNNTAYGQKLIIIKSDTLGNLIGIKDINSMYQYEARNVVYDFNTNKIYISGLNYNTNPFTSYNLTCLDTLGNIIWNKQISSSTDFYFNDLEIVGNELLVCGQKKVSNILSNGEHRLYFAKYNISNGDLIFEKMYGNAFLQNSLSDLHVMPNGQIVLIGSYSDKPLFSSLRHDGVILKIKPNGDSLWMRTYSNFSGSQYESFYNVKPSLDGGYIICGSPYNAPAPQNQSWVVKTDSLGMAPGLVTTGIGNEFAIKTIELSIYPNPTKNKLHLAFTNPQLKEDITTIKLIDALGKTIKTITQIQEQQTLDIEELPKGIYLLQFQTKTGVSKSYKILKE